MRKIVEDIRMTMMFDSRWQAHRASVCEPSCWYCEHPGIGSSGWRLVSRSTPTRPKLGKAATRAAKRLRVRAMKG
jgi:hypothetical protein